MKRMICLILIIFFVLPLWIPADADSIEKPILSPAISVLKERAMLVKGNLIGSRINFSAEDFTEVIGTKNFKSITINSLPEKTIGSLYLSGFAVTQGQVIPKKELEKLFFLPSGQSEGSTLFTFSQSGNTQELCCKITYDLHENTQPKAENMSISTYRNIAVFSQIKIESTGEIASIRILEGCRNGILTLNEKNGSFSYRPATNFTGSDRFTYQIVDDYGNTSQVKTIKIIVEKAEKNLYFYDCAENPNHANAIFVCEKGLMNYTLDENCLPIFNPEETVDFESFMKTTMCAMKFQEEGDWGSFAMEDSHLSIETAAAILCQILKEEEGLALPVISTAEKEKLSAVETLKTLGILTSQETQINNQPLNKSNCAALIAGMIQFREKSF